MQNSSVPRTSLTLLGRLRKESVDQDAWREFVRRYGPLIYSWCRKWKLQEADAQDVTQAVLVKLAQKMRTFEHDVNGRFRGYLKTLTITPGAISWKAGGSRARAAATRRCSRAC